MSKAKLIFVLISLAVEVYRDVYQRDFSLLLSSTIYISTTNWLELLPSHGRKPSLSLPHPVWYHVKGKGDVHLQAIRYGEDWFVKGLTVRVADEEIVHISPGKNM